MILDKQNEYCVDLVNNADFEIWAGSYNNEWWVDPDEELNVYGYDDEMIAYWGDSSNPEKYVDSITTVGELRTAIWELYYFRKARYLEAPPPMFRRLDMWWSPESEYEMCSDATKDVAFKLVSYRAGGSINGTMYMLYPLLDDIPDWMDD